MCGNWPNIIFYLNQKKLNQIPPCHLSAHAIWDMMLTRFCYSQAPYPSPQLPYCHILHTPPPPAYCWCSEFPLKGRAVCWLTLNYSWLVGFQPSPSLQVLRAFWTLCLLLSNPVAMFSTLPSLSPAHMLKRQLFPLGKRETSCYCFYI